jgi:hypothetical protein
MDTPPVDASFGIRPAPASGTSYRRTILLWLAVVGVALAALLTVVWLGDQASQTTAYTLLFVAPGVPSTHFHQRTFELKRYREAQPPLVKSRVVLQAALRRPEVAKLSVVRDHADPVAWLQGALEVDFRFAPDIMRVALRGHKGDELVAVVQAVTDAYLEEVVKPDQKRFKEQVEEFRKIERKYEDLMERKRRPLRDTEDAVETTGVPPLERQPPSWEFPDNEGELRRVHLARIAASERAAKDKGAAWVEVMLLDAQEELLLAGAAEAKAGLARTRGQDVRLLREDLDQAEHVRTRLSLQVMDIDAELAADSSVTVLVPAILKGDWLRYWLKALGL